MRPEEREKHGERKTKETEMGGQIAAGHSETTERTKL
jgi:hypothetical protein